jgi:hypothetical protein
MIRSSHQLFNKRVGRYPKTNGQFFYQGVSKLAIRRIWRRKRNQKRQAQRGLPFVYIAGGICLPRSWSIFAKTADSGDDNELRPTFDWRLLP